MSSTTSTRVALFAFGLAFVQCGSDDSEGSGGTGDAASGGATSGGSAGTGGSTASGGSNATGGATSSGGSTATGGSTGTGQPIGAICVNDGNCNQANGAAVCCAVTGCSSPCECQLEADCPSGTLYLACESTPDCDRFGGGKICCDAEGMDPFCTKQNGCPGQILP